MHLGRFLRSLQDASRLNRHRPVRYIHLADPIQSSEAKHDLPSAVVRHRAAHQTRVATLRDDSHAMCGTHLQHSDHFRRVGGSYHHPGLALVASTPVALKTCSLGASEQMAWANNGGEGAL